MKIKGYEIMLLLDWGFKPSQIIGMGYNKKTVNKFSHVYNETLNLLMIKIGSDQTKVVRRMKSLWLEALTKKQY